MNNQTPFERNLPDLQTCIEVTIIALRLDHGLSEAEAHAPLKWTERGDRLGLREAWTSIPLPGGAGPAHRIEVHLYPGEVGVESFAVHTSHTDLDEDDLNHTFIHLREAITLVWVGALRNLNARQVKPQPHPDDDLVEPEEHEPLPEEQDAEADRHHDHLFRSPT